MIPTDILQADTIDHHCHAEQLDNPNVLTREQIFSPHEWSQTLLSGGGFHC